MGAGDQERARARAWVRRVVEEEKWEPLGLQGWRDGAAKAGQAEEGATEQSEGGRGGGWAELGRRALGDCCVLLGQMTVLETARGWDDESGGRGRKSLAVLLVEDGLNQGGRGGERGRIGQWVDSRVRSHMSDVRNEFLRRIPLPIC